MAAITFSLVMAVVGGFLFGHAVSTPPKSPSQTASEEPKLTAKAPAEKRSEPQRWPAPGAKAKAVRIAKSRAGTVSFAAIGPAGATVAFRPERPFFAASVAKAMLLVAELRRLERESQPLDARTRALLEAMITFSDNDTAEAIYERVGDTGWNEVAELSGMTRFAGDVGHWSNVN